MSVNDFSGRFDEPSTGRLQRLLSNNASTDCCSMRFSLRTMTSGAFKSTSFFNRLLRLMIRRYKSFKSLVAKLPESSRTSGRKSGGMTGITSRTIHSGLLSLSRRASMILSRLIRSFDFCWLLVTFSSARNCTESSTRLSRINSFLTASAPISTSKASSPYLARAWRTSSSVSIWHGRNGVSPGSITT
jgi:hypothetical protein